MTDKFMMNSLVQVNKMQQKKVRHKYKTIMILNVILNHLTPIFDFVICGEEVEPPLVLNCPLCAIIYLSCCILSSLQILEYLRLRTFNYYFLYLSN
jgi:hypothetical protein